MAPLTSCVGGGALGGTTSGARGFADGAIGDVGADGRAAGSALLSSSSLSSIN
jgi:hypothetical protein